MRLNPGSDPAKTALAEYFEVPWNNPKAPVQVTARIEEMDRVIQQTAKKNEACQWLTDIPGVYPVTASDALALPTAAMRAVEPNFISVHEMYAFYE